MQQLEKIHRVITKQIPDAPHETLLVLDATAGQNALSQAQGFSTAAKCTGIVLPGVYDGIAVWQCPDGLHNRFAETNERRVAHGGDPWFPARAVAAADAWIAANS